MIGEGALTVWSGLNDGGGIGLLVVRHNDPPKSGGGRSISTTVTNGDGRRSLITNSSAHSAQAEAWRSQLNRLPEIGQQSCADAVSVPIMATWRHTRLPPLRLAGTDSMSRSLEMMASCKRSSGSRPRQTRRLGSSRMPARPHQMTHKASACGGGSSWHSRDKWWDVSSDWIRL